MKDNMLPNGRNMRWVMTATKEKLNLTMLCDFYELTMGNGYFKYGFKDRITYFDVFFRKLLM